MLKVKKLKHKPSHSIYFSHIVNSVHYNFIQNENKKTVIILLYCTSSRWVKGDCDAVVLLF